MNNLNFEINSPTYSLPVKPPLPTKSVLYNRYSENTINLIVTKIPIKEKKMAYDAPNLDKSWKCSPSGATKQILISVLLLLICLQE